MAVECTETAFKARMGNNCTRRALQGAAESFRSNGCEGAPQ